MVFIESLRVVNAECNVQTFKFFLYAMSGGFFFKKELCIHNAILLHILRLKMFYPYAHFFFRKYLKGFCR